MVCSLIFSIALYSAETCTFKAADRQRVDAFEICRHMLRVPWTAYHTSIYILKQVIIENTWRRSTTTLQQILQYFGHIERRDTNNLFRTSNGEWWIAGKRPRGRSSKRWSVQISEDLKIPVSDALNQATERYRWRQLVDGIKRTYDSLSSEKTTKQRERVVPLYKWALE